MANFTRRKFIQAAGGVAAVSTLGFPAIVGAASKKVVIVGGGVGGATAAKYIRMADSSDRRHVDRAERTRTTPAS